MSTQRKSTRVKAPDSSSMSNLPMLVPANTHDGLILKPLGRSKPNSDKGEMERLVRCKIPVIISTFNIQTLRSTAKKEELAHESQHYGIDIICLQEHRIEHLESLLQETFTSGYVLITSSAWKNSRNAATGGVGFLISPRALKSCRSIVGHNERTIEITLQLSCAVIAFIMNTQKKM